MIAISGSPLVNNQLNTNFNNFRTILQFEFTFLTKNLIKTLNVGKPEENQKTIG